MHVNWAEHWNQMEKLRVSDTVHQPILIYSLMFVTGSFIDRLYLEFEKCFVLNCQFDILYPTVMNLYKYQCLSLLLCSFTRT